MTFSVIIPLYKGKQYIKPIIEMLERNEKLLRNYYKDACLDIVFVNDYPSEYLESKGILELKYRIYNHEHNAGIHKSRVDGLREAKGEYVLFLDQDDQISDDFFLTQLTTLKKENADWVVCNGVFRTIRKIYSSEQDVRNVLDEKYYFSDPTDIISPGQVLIKKSIIPNVWKENILSYNYCDDAFLWMLLKNNRNKLAYNDTVGYFHNEDGNNLSFSWKKNANALKELRDTILRTKCLNDENTRLFCQGADAEIYKQETFAELDVMYDPLSNREIGDDIERVLNGRSIVIYGYGIWGRKLHTLLDENKITVAAVIDRSIKGTIDDVTVFLPEELRHHVHNIDNCMLIITPVLNEDAIRGILKKCGVKQYMTITDFFNALVKQTK